MMVRCSVSNLSRGVKIYADVYFLLHLHDGNSSARLASFVSSMLQRTRASSVWCRSRKTFESRRRIRSRSAFTFTALLLTLWFWDGTTNSGWHVKHVPNFGADIGAFFQCAPADIALSLVGEVGYFQDAAADRSTHSSTVIRERGYSTAGI